MKFTQKIKDFFPKVASWFKMTTEKSDELISKDELDKNYKQGISYQDYLQGDTLVKLSDDQIAFKEANPTAPYTI